MHLCHIICIKLERNEKYIIYLFLACFLVSCANKNVESVKVDYKEIDLVSAVEKTERKNIETYCKHISYVKLETKDDVLLKSPSYEFTSNSIIAYEGAFIYQFSYKGEYLNSYVNHGQGPKDLLGINKVLWDENRQLLYVLDGALGKMIILDENLTPYRFLSVRTDGGLLRLRCPLY